MIDFFNLADLLTPEERALQARVRAFVDSEVLPIIEQAYADGHFPRELIPRLAELGLLRHHYPSLTCGDVAHGLVSYELERGDAGLRSFVSVQTSLCMYPIARYGSPEQQERYLPAMARGELIGSFALTEPGHGSDPAGMETTATSESSGYVLNGVKRWSTNSTIADLVIVWAKCEGQIRGFLVERDTPGLTVHPIHDKLSMRASESGWLELNECRIPARNALPGAVGLRTALSCLNEARYSIVWGVLGAAEACYTAALERVQGRVQFGKPLAGFQLVQDKLVDMLAELTKGQLLALQLGRLKEQGQAHPAQISLGKRENVRAAQRVARLARELLGGDGITQMFPAMRHLCNLETVATYEGTDDIHTLIVGEHITGLAAFR